MTTQPTGPMIPGVAAAAGHVGTGDDSLTTDDETRATDEGVPVGEADLEADRERSGAPTDDDDDGGLLSPSGNAARPDVDDTTTADQGVAVGEADLEADRRRTGADEDAV
jgi:hypothetical protein